MTAGVNNRNASTRWATVYNQRHLQPHSHFIHPSLLLATTFTMSVITVDQAFAAPASIGTRSERFRVRINAGHLSVAQLKQAIVRKAHPGLNHVASFALVLPDGMGTVLNDSDPASSIPPSSTLLALSAACVTFDTLPSILYTYHGTSIRAFVRLPSQLPVPNSGVWKCHRFEYTYHTAELGSALCRLGFDRGLVAHQMDLAKADWQASIMTDTGLSPEMADEQAKRRGRGHLLPFILDALWKHAGLEKVVERQRLQNAMLERRIVDTQNAVSVASISDDATSTIRPGPSQQLTAATLRHHSKFGGDSYAQSYFSAHDSTTAGVTSVAPKLDQVVKQFFSNLCGSTSVRGHSIKPVATAPSCASSVASLSDLSDSSLSSLSSVSYASSESGESLAPSFTQTVHHNVSTMTQASETSVRYLELAARYSALARQLHRRRRSSRRASTNSCTSPTEQTGVNSQEEDSYRLETERMKQMLRQLEVENQTLRQEAKMGEEVVCELLENVGELVWTQSQRRRAEEALKMVSELRDELIDVVTCSICCNRYTSASTNPELRPIHLSCGHIFCAGCLRNDWTIRWENGEMMPQRCFNKCHTFNPNQLGEVYLLQSVAAVVDSLPNRHDEDEVEVARHEE